MQSKLLQRYHIPHYISGMDNNLRQATAGDAFVSHVEDMVNDLAYPIKDLYSGQQVHGSQVAYVDGKQGQEALVGKTFQETDGLYTDQVGVGLWVKFADCTPVVLYDRKHHAIAIVHSGWRGTVKKISEKAIRKMAQRFNSQVEDLIAYVGPSIGQDDYEVGPEVYEAFADFADRDDFFYQKGDKYHLSMTAANVSILRNNGLSPYNIEVEEAVTYGNPALHSAREEGQDYGLNAMVVALPDK